MANRLLNVAARTVAGPDSPITKAIQNLPEINTNVGTVERIVSLVAGGLFMTRGFTNRGPGLLSILAGGSLIYRGISGHCSCYQALGISTAEGQGPATVIPANQGVKVEASVTVHKPVHDVYEEWRKLEHLPQFMSHLKEVRPQGEYKSHWVAEGPMGMSVEWDAEITNDNRDETIAWQSVDGSEIDTAGSVHFRPVENGETEVRVNLKFNPPGGRLGAAFAKLLGNDPEAQIREDLQRFKQLMETGETMENEGGRSPRSENL